ncbi:MAG: hypothetical protein JJ863_09655 [Deltaproteobacteria bacterium]|nr:hypothetical protein [Deltaproteobacteria bacterium]
MTLSQSSIVARSTDSDALDATAAIARGAQSLLERQRPDGSWQSDTDMGPIGLATALLAESLFRPIRAHEAQGARTYFAARQLPDGGFEPYPGAGTASVGVTALVWATLRACGASEGDPVFDRATQSLNANGGLEAAGRGFLQRGDMAALFLVATGHVHRDSLPVMPAGAGLMPLALLTRSRLHAGNVMVFMVVIALAEKTQSSTRRPGFLEHTRRLLEMKRIVDYLLRWQNDDGSWNGSSLQTATVLLGLHAAGLGAEEPAVARALAWLDTMKREHDHELDLSAMDTDVWSTALGALALFEAGENTSSVERATAYLLDAQSRTPMLRENLRKRGAVRTGGWPFQRGNDTMPDTDDTGVVVATLATLAGKRAERALFRAIDDGLEWLRGMQNSDGGWPTFVWGLPSKDPGPLFVRDLTFPFDDPIAMGKMMLEPPPELGDPAVEGVTGRVLWGFGAAGSTVDDEPVARAIEFLRHQQCDNGAWWGRWKACYLAETATVLLGLAAVGERPSAEYVKRALGFLIAHQNEDGGFGETPAAYRDPSAGGRGPSMPPVTAYVLLGLEAMDAPRAVRERAAGYLLDQQRADGTWDNAGWLHTFIPPDLFYTYPLPATALSVLALARHVASA